MCLHFTVLLSSSLHLGTCASELTWPSFLLLCLHLLTLSCLIPFPHSPTYLCLGWEISGLRINTASHNKRHEQGKARCPIVSCCCDQVPNGIYLQRKAYLNSLLQRIPSVISRKAMQDSFACGCWSGLFIYWQDQGWRWLSKTHP